MELLLGSSGDGALGGRIEVQAVIGPGERTSGLLQLGPAMAELQGLLGRLQTRQATDAEVVRLGSLLFEGLFYGSLGAAYREARGRARAGGAAMRLVITSTAAESAALPWEFLYDPSLRHFLSLTPEVRLVRNLSSLRPINPTPGALPLRVLVGVAGPTTHKGQRLAGLDATAERNLIRDALAPLADAGYLQVQHLALDSPSHLVDAIRRTRPHIFHYIGHSGVVGGAPLLFSGPVGGEAVPMSGAQLATTLGLAP